MFAHQTVNLHLPMIIGAARDLVKRGNMGGLGQLAGPDPSPNTGGASYGDDFWQDYVWRTTDRVLHIFETRGPVEQQYHQAQPPPPGGANQPPVTTNREPPKDESISLTTNQAMLLAGGILIYFVAKRGK